MGRWLDGFDAQALRDWAAGLGVETYVGSSGRVFPVDRKAAPLLRGWVRRLKEQGVRLHANHRWIGWVTTARFASPLKRAKSRFTPMPPCWPWGRQLAQLGSDGAWVAALQRRVAWMSRRCSRPIAVSMWTGRRSSPSATPARR